MKKLLFIVTLISLSAVAGAQISSNALGARLYGGDSFSGAELSYQKGLNDRNRLELDASFGFSSEFTRVALVGIYHWDWNIAGGFNWYVGPGASVAYDNFNENSYVNIGLGGQIGIDAPEPRNTGTRPKGFFGAESTSYLRELLRGKKVRLEYDVSRLDRYRRTLAYAYLEDGTFINAELVRNGYATVMTMPPNVKYAETFNELASKARKQKKGLWKESPSLK